MINKIRHVLKTVGRLLLLLWQSRPLFLLGLLVLTVMQGLVPPATAWLTKKILDVLEGTVSAGAGELPAVLFVFIGAQVGVTLLSQLLPPTTRFFNDELGRSLKYAVQSMVYGRINALQGMEYFENPRFHDTIRLAVEGSQHAAIQGFNLLKDIVQQLITLLSFFSVLLLFDIWMALLVFASAVPQFYARLRISLLRFGLAGDLSPRERRMYYLGALLNMPESAKEIRLFNTGSYMLKRFLETLRGVNAAQRVQDAREWRWQLLLDVIASAAAAFVFVHVVLAAAGGRISLGDVVLYSTAVLGVQAALTGLMVSTAGLNESALFYSHMQQLESLHDSIALAPEPRPANPLKKGIELQNVSFRYSPEHPWVLRDVSLTIPAGQCLALVGLNGAGKTTLVKLLTRLYDPTGGRILWDGTDIRKLDVHQLRRNISAIFQDFMRYDFTAAENIGLGRVESIDDREAIVAAARRAGVHEMISALPRGYDTVLSRWLVEDQVGMDLSGGEWQKIAIARMYMREASVLILDEPTAALDGRAELDVYTRFAEVSGRHTSILISHRFSTVKMADRIVVLKDGAVCEDGSHRELLEQGGVYAELYQAQARRYQ